MSLKIRRVQQALSTGTGTQDFTVSGFGTPKAYIVFVSSNTTLNSSAAHAILSMGAGDGTRQWVACTVSEDAQSTSDVRREGMTDESILLLDPNGAVDGEMNFNSFITDGVRFDIGDSFSAGFLATVILFGGTDLSAYAEVVTQTAGTDSSQDFTNFGSQPDLVIFSGHTTAFDSGSDNFSLSFGAASNNGAISQGAISQGEGNGYATTEPATGIRNDAVYISISSTGGGTFSRWVEVTSFLSTGFQLTKRGSSSSSLAMGTLSLKFNGAFKAEVNVFTTPTSTGQFSRTSFDFKPQFLMFIPSLIETINTVSQTNALGAGAVGASIVDGFSETSIVASAERGVATTNTQSIVTDRLDFYDGAGSKVFDVELASFDATGYTIDFIDTEANAKQWIEIGIEEEPPPGPGPPVVDSLQNHSFAVETIARHAGESLYPGLWRGLEGAWIPGLGSVQGSRSTDLSIYRNHATNTGLSKTPGRGKTLPLFEGGSDMIAAPGSSRYAPSNGYSIHFWCRVDANAGPYRGPASFFASDQGWAFTWYIGRLYFAQNIQNRYRMNSIHDFSSDYGTWHHIVVTVSSSNVQRLYVDAVLEATETDFDGDITPPTGGTQVRWGKYHTNDTMTGSLDDMRIYSRELSAQEVLTCYRVDYAPFLKRFSEFSSTPPPPATGGLFNLKMTGIGR